MSRILPIQGLLLNLEGKIEPIRREYLPREEAYEQLKAETGQDFGYDAKAWRAWMKQNKLGEGSFPMKKDGPR